MSALPLRLSSLLVSVLLLAGAAAAQQVHVVASAAGPGVDFTSVQSAVNAAADGDVILIQPGNYEAPVALANRGVTLAGLPGPGGAAPQLGQLVISGLATGKSVHVRGLHVGAFLTESSLDVLDCAGPVLLEDLLVTGLAFIQPMRMRVERSHKVVVTRSSISGAVMVGGTASSPGLETVDATVSLYDCSVTGAVGKDAGFVFGSLESPGTDGGPGLRASGSTVFLSGSTVAGGRGGHGIDNVLGPSGCLPPSDGGNGVELTDTLVRRMDTAFVAGAAGTPASCGPLASPGTELVTDGASLIVDVPETLRTLSIGSPVEQGGSCSIEIHGQPFEPVILLQALAAQGTWLGGLKGTLAGAPPYVTYTLGTLDGTGTLAFTVGIPANLLPLGIEGVVIIDQCVTAAASGGGLLSSPSTLVLVDSLP